MPTEEFAFLQLKKSDVIDIHQALLGRWLLENKLRQAQGLEDVGPSFLMYRLEHLLNLSEQETHSLYHHAQDELWEYTWHTYTDEWAWHRAEQDVRTQLGRNFTQLHQEQREELICKRYEDKLETYLAEITIPDEPTTADTPNKQKTKTQNK